MKRRICSILLLVMMTGISAGCSATGNPTDTENANATTDTENADAMDDAISNPADTENTDTTDAVTSSETDDDTEEEVVVSALSVSEEAYYFVESVNSEIYEDETWKGLYGFRYMCYDPESDSVFALCGIDGCSHNTLSCNAYYDVNDEEDKYLGVFSIEYDDGYLYQIGYSYEEKALYLYRVKVDGTIEMEAYRKLAEVDFNDGDGNYTYLIPAFAIDEGYLYYSNCYSDSSEGPQKLYRMELESGDTEALYEADSSTPEITYLSEYGQYLYFLQKAETTEESTKGYIYRYDKENGAIEWIADAVPGRYAVNSSFLYYIEDDNLYVCSLADQSVSVVCGNITEEADEVIGLFATEEAVILSLLVGEGTVLEAYDSEGNLLTQMECEAGESSCRAVDENYLYGSRFIEGDVVVGESDTHTSIMKMEDFLQGIGEWEDIT